MEETGHASRITINLIRGCLVATIQVDLDRRVLEGLRKDLLGRLDTSRSRRIILDCSGVEVMDAEDFDGLRRAVAMASLMGARTVLAGLRPGVVSALVDMSVDLEGVETALSLDDAFEMLERTDGPATEEPGAEGAEDDEGTSDVPTQ